MILTVLIFMYCPFFCEKILTFYVCFFHHISRQADVATLKYFGYKTVNEVPLPLKEMEKEEIGMELFRNNMLR